MRRESKPAIARFLSLEDVILKNITNRARGISLEQNQLHYGISLKLYFVKKAFDPACRYLLRGVESTGSLPGAAQAMNMAYSKAWKMLRESEKAWGFASTERGDGRKGRRRLHPLRLRPSGCWRHTMPLMAETRHELDRLFEQHFSQEWVEELKQSAEQADE